MEKFVAVNLTESRGREQVDYGAYMHDLARDIGAAPHLSRWLTHPKVLIAYAFGQAYITFFRYRTFVHAVSLSHEAVSAILRAQTSAESLGSLYMLHPVHKSASLQAVHAVDSPAVVSV